MFRRRVRGRPHGSPAWRSAPIYDSNFVDTDVAGTAAREITEHELPLRAAVIGELVGQVYSVWSGIVASIAERDSATMARPSLERMVIGKAIANDHEHAARIWCGRMNPEVGRGVLMTVLENRAHDEQRAAVGVVDAGAFRRAVIDEKPSAWTALATVVHGRKTVPIGKGKLNAWPRST